MADPACCLGVSFGMSCMLIRDLLPVGYAVMKSVVCHQPWQHLGTGRTAIHMPFPHADMQDGRVAKVIFLCRPLQSGKVYFF